MADTALVTGASGGIGLEISRVLAERGYDLILVARNGEALEKISRELSEKYGVSARYYAMDLADTGSADSLYAKTGDVDILVNNAGFGDYGLFHESDWNRLESMIKLNDLTLAKMTYLYVRGMVSRRKGRVMNIASVAGFQPGPYMSVYYASKAFVLSLTEAVHEEIRKTGVTATAVCPGPVDTNFFRAANAHPVFRRMKHADPRKVALKSCRAMMKGKAVFIPGWTYKIAIFAERILPRFVLVRIFGRIQKSRRWISESFYDTLMEKDVKSVYTATSVRRA